MASPQLKRAARLREFLLYVGRRSIKDGLDQIHEQEIGANVFGRPANYDTSLDNIVRVNASELRKRIEDYFESDGADETLVMEVPRGSYKPVFRKRVAEPGIQPATIVDASSAPLEKEAPAKPPSPAGVERRLLVFSGILIVVLAAACWVLWTQNHALRRSLITNAWQSTPAVGSFWSEILGGRPNTDIVLADTSFALIEDITKTSIPLSDYLKRDYIARIQSPNLSADRRADLSMIMQRNNGSLGDFGAAQHILALDPSGKTLRIYSARDYSPALVNQDNIILIGARKSNPWVDLFADSMNFSASYDLARSVDFIRNKAPAPGEQETYYSSPAPSTGGYCVVAYLPNPRQPGKVLIIAGTDSAATEGGGNFLTSEDQLSRFQKMLHVATLPYFEVILKTSNLNGTPIDARIVAYRTHPGPH
ncbi:MAG TPA: hypothetical protein VMW15_16815 [Terracidiphilus sp.]|nr:hypothetical protein [Terracidiphilus sp.]